VDYVIENAKLSQKALKVMDEEQLEKLRYGVDFMGETVRERCELSRDAVGTR
jgi:hypothetical protein